MNKWRIGIVFCALCQASFAAAQTEPIVRAEITPGTVNIGEAVELRVIVLVPTWFPRPPVYPNFELSNAITRLPPDSSNPLRERIGRESWSGIERRYRIYPLLGATYRLSGKTIKVTYADPGADPITVDMAVPDVVFRGAVPAGAEVLDPYLAGRSLTLTLEVDGATDDLKAGDALVLEYRAELDGLPAIFLPPLAAELDFEGAAVYADEPQLSDGPPARRSEKLTLIFEDGGEFTAPERTLRYWNTDRESVETVAAPGFMISVAGPPAESKDIETGSARPSWQSGLLLAALLAVGFFLVRGWPGLSGWYAAEVQRRRQSEAYAFRQVRDARKTDSPQVLYAALLAWLSRLAPGLELRVFAETFGDETLTQQLSALSACLYTTAASDPPSLQELESRIVSARKRYLEQERAASRLSLSSLNP